MQAVDLGGVMGDYYADKKLKIPNAHLNSVCKIHQAKQTCRYISLTADGYYCIKKTPIKDMIDQQVKTGEWTAEGDNCEGLGKIKRGK